MVQQQNQNNLQQQQQRSNIARPIIRIKKSKELTSDLLVDPKSQWEKWNSYYLIFVVIEPFRDSGTTRIAVAVISVTALSWGHYLYDIDN